MEFSKESEGNGLFSLINKEMAMLKEILLSRIDKMRLAIEEAEGLAGSEIQQWDELKNGLETKIATLKGELQEKEEGLRVRESAIKEMEESLATKVHGLENQIREKEELVVVRDGEMNDLKSKMDALVSRITQMASAITEAEALAAAEAQQVKETKEGLEAKVALLENQLQEKEEGLHVRESAIEEKEESLTWPRFAAKLHDLERRLGEKEALLEVRETEINDLRSKADVVNVPPQDLITFREEDAVAVRGSEEEGGRARPGTRDGEEAEGQEQMAAEMQRLTAELQEKDVLLSAREMEVKMVKQSMEKRIKELERIVKRQAGEKQKKSRLKNDLKPKMDALVSRITQMESAIKEAEALAAAEAQQVKETKEGLEAKVALLENQLQEKEEGLHVRESAIEEREESPTWPRFAAKLHDLEHRLGEKEALLEVRETEINDLRSKADVVNVPPQDLITLREEDAVAVRGSEEEGGRARPGTRDGEEAEGQEQMAAEMQRLTAEIKEKDVLLSAREMEVKMVKQSMEERIKELERIVKRQAGEEQKKSRLVSFLAPIEKRH